MECCWLQACQTWNPRMDTQAVADWHMVWRWQFSEGWRVLFSPGKLNSAHFPTPSLVAKTPCLASSSSITTNINSSPSQVWVCSKLRVSLKSTWFHWISYSFLSLGHDTGMKVEAPTPDQQQRPCVRSPDLLPPPSPSQPSTPVNSSYAILFSFSSQLSSLTRVFFISHFLV